MKLTKKLRKEINVIVEYYKNQLYMQVYDIYINYSSAIGVIAYVKSSNSYKWIKLFIDVSKIETNPQLHFVIRHELLHVLHSRFDDILKKSTRDLKQDIQTEIFNQSRIAVEEFVSTLEKILDYSDINLN